MPTLEIRVIKPRRFIDPAKMRAAIEKAYNEVAEGAKADLEKTTATWDHGVKFEIFRPFGASGGIYVTTDSDLYELVSERGARPHTIVPRALKRLRYRKPFKAKTIPGVIASYRGGKGNIIVSARRVHHPGFKARRFISLVTKKWEGGLARKVNSAIAAEA